MPLLPLAAEALARKALLLQAAIAGLIASHKVEPQVACFLALRLEVDLQRRLDERQVDVSWPDLMRDLTEVRAVDLAFDGQRYRLRTDLRGSAYHAFAAAGVRPPALVTPLGPAPPPSPSEPEVAVPAYGKVRPLSRNYPESRESQKQTVENQCELLRPVVGRAPHPQRRVRRLGVVVVEPPAELRQDRLGIPEFGAVHVIAFERPYEGLGEAVALRAVRRAS